MRLLTLLSILIPAPVLADPGHLGDVAGHDHWVAAVAAGAAVAVGVRGWLKWRRENPAEAAPGAEAEEGAGEA